MKKYFDNKTILVTGGTGSFGKKMAEMILKNFKPKKLIIFSRDEYKQYVMRSEFIRYDENLRFFLGDVRDHDRLARAFDGVDMVIHAAALKQVPALEYNPMEAVKTNILGAMNVINAAIERKVKKVIALSTDKAVNPINLYGGTKLVSDKLFVAANAYVGAKNKTIFSVVRYGNVADSRGSVIPLFRDLLTKGSKFFPITDFRMTRFWLALDQAVSLVFKAIRRAQGGEIFVARCPSFKIVDLAKAMDLHLKLKETGVRPGEKLHEIMITEEDATRTFEYDNYYVIYPCLDFWNPKNNYINGGKKVSRDFHYASNLNRQWLTVSQIKKLL